jgi:hypothetical protein
VMLQVNSSCRSIEILNGQFCRLKIAKVQFMMRQLQARFCLALVDRIELLSKQMFC